VDFSLNKNWTMRERYRLQFRAEFFNLLNHPSFNGFANTPFNINNATNSGGTTIPGFVVTPRGGFGLLTSDRGPRNIQFGLKMNF
jgi:hypothetical protein